eukprot:COSAG06_NODE_2483_length_6793_cov_7.869435_3_plen_427_part_00
MAGGVAEQQETEQPRQVKEFLAAEENEPPYPVTMLQTIAWYERAGCDPARPRRFALLWLLLSSTFGVTNTIVILYTDPSLSPLGRWRPQVPMFLLQASMSWDLLSQYVVLMRNDSVISWWHCSDSQRAMVGTALQKRLDDRVLFYAMVAFSTCFYVPFWVSLQKDVSVVSVVLTAGGQSLMFVWAVWHSYMDAAGFSFAGAFVAQVQREFENELLDERKLSFQQALVRYAEMGQMSRSVVSKATSQITPWILLMLLSSMVALYDGLLMPWAHPFHGFIVCNLFVMFPGLVLPLVKIGGTFQAQLLRRLVGCDGVGSANGSVRKPSISFPRFSYKNDQPRQARDKHTESSKRQALLLQAQLWSAEERVLFIQHAQVSHVPMTLVGVEINEKMMGFLMAGAASAIAAFWDHSSNRGFEGFAFDRHDAV